MSVSSAEEANTQSFSTKPSPVTSQWELVVTSSFHCQTEIQLIAEAQNILIISAQK